MEGLKRYYQLRADFLQRIADVTDLFLSVDAEAPGSGTGVPHRARELRQGDTTKEHTVSELLASLALTAMDGRQAEASQLVLAAQPLEEEFRAHCEEALNFIVAKKVLDTDRNSISITGVTRLLAAYLTYFTEAAVRILMRAIRAMTLAVHPGRKEEEPLPGLGLPQLEKARQCLAKLEVGNDVGSLR